MKYADDFDVVVPKYSVVLALKLLSGLRLHSVHLYVGFGTFGAVLHGIIFINIDIKNIINAIVTVKLIF